MNILPLVLSFLLVLALTSFSLLKERQATRIESEGYRLHMQQMRSFRNEKAKLLYDQLFTKKPRTPPPKPTEPKAPPSFVKEKTKEQEEEMKQKRKRMRTGPPSLFNLASLLDNPPPELEKIALTLLTSLYGHLPSFQENADLPKELLHHLLETYREKKPLSSLATLLEEPSFYHEILYKMMKGTRLYDLAKKTGYPPLEEFFSFYPEDKCAILFHFASLPLLEALLGKEALPTLHELELEQWRRGGKRGAYALKADVEKLLQKKSLRENLAVALKDSISYRHVVPSTRPSLFSEEEEEEEEELFDYLSQLI